MTQVVINTKDLPESVRSKFSSETTSDQVEIEWLNGCNEEGEEYYNIIIWDIETGKELFESNDWGSIESLDDALKELKEETQ